ncbi:hypothetical protein DO97_20295 [Neosynechococcus sphagnicola sy1]|uniref:Uncharacterized protein n=1 Tax=Neosynechococcus sphagnicola sy1 TaxID=1497020 RepID=A0A098TM78_9CYAN|nr:Asr1405/Asl0597 family protein [Neosynechococcus sphagnicola]KGF73420.1 hypothetical protein DO97_20295 [Neosynechococcus sphagnicola sy1]
MNSSSLNSQIGQVVSIPRCDRWQAYQRLQELSIPCCCTEDGSLRVSIESPGGALQLWSVVQQLTASRPKLVYYLEQCWQLAA